MKFEIKYICILFLYGSCSAGLNAQETISSGCGSVPEGSVVLTGLPSTGTWTLTRNPDGITTTGSGTSITISGLAPGTYTFTVTNESGCTSPPSANVVINPVTSTFSITAYPNPFADHVCFDLQIKTDSKVRLELYNLNGTKVVTVFDDAVVGFDHYWFEYIPENLSPGTLIYRLIVDDQLMFTEKLIHY